MSKLKSKVSKNYFFSLNYLIVTFKKLSTLFILLSSLYLLSGSSENVYIFPKISLETAMKKGSIPMG